MALTLQPLWGNQALDLRSLGLWLGCLLSFFGWKLPPDYILGKIIVLGQIEQLSDLAGSFGSQSTRNNSISQPRNVIISLLDDDQVQHCQI